MPLPAFTVVMPLYNKEDYVKSALASVVAQNWPALEIVVVDDGSTDAGAQRVLEMHIPGLQLITQKNAGVSVARNTGISHASHPLVAFLDADDVWQPGYLAAIANLVADFPAAVFYATAYERVDKNGHRTSSTLNGWKIDQRGVVGDFYKAWGKSSFACTCSIVIRRQAIDEIGVVFPPGERLGEDQDLWFRLAESGQLAYFNQPLVDYRVEVPGSATANNFVLDILPCFQRLESRLHAFTVPKALRRGAEKLLASHYINVARARAKSGAVPGAWALLRCRAAWRNPLYWIRTVFWLLRLQG